MNLSRLSFGGKLAITLVVINVLFGLLFAQIAVRYAVSSKDGEPGISMADIRLFFQGDPTRCRLQTMTNGPMRNKFASFEEKEALDDWIADGAPRETYDSAIAPILQARCVKCHGPGGEKANSPLTTFDQVSRFVESSDTGAGYEDLASVSYRNIILMTCLTALAVGLFYLTRFRGAWKEVLMIVSFAAILCNIISWWSAKQSNLFLHIIVATGVLLAVSIVVMAVMTLVDVWILPERSDEDLD